MRAIQGWLIGGSLLLARGAVADNVSCEQAVDNVIRIWAQSENEDELRNYYGDVTNPSSELSFADLRDEMRTTCTSIAPSQEQLACLAGAKDLAKVTSCGAPAAPQVVEPPDPWTTLPTPLPAISEDGTHVALYSSDRAIGESWEYVDVLPTSAGFARRFDIRRTDISTDPAPVPPVFVVNRSSVVTVDDDARGKLVAVLTDGKFAKAPSGDAPAKGQWTVDGVEIKVTAKGSRSTVTIREGGKSIGKTTLEGEGMSVETVVVIRSAKLAYLLVQVNDFERQTSEWRTVKIRPRAAAGGAKK